MKLQGSISVLIGCHSIIHSYYVWKAWRVLYRSNPRTWETVCILVHDLGHLGTNYLDNLEEKKGHWRLGARIARFFLGQKGYDLTAGHCDYSGVPLSRLYKADKYSWIFEPRWWAYMNCFFEPKLRMGYSCKEAYERFHHQVRQNINSGQYRSTHELYLERCRGIKNRDKEKLCS